MTVTCRFPCSVEEKVAVSSVLKYKTLLMQFVICTEAGLILICILLINKITENILLMINCE